LTKTRTFAFLLIMARIARAVAPGIPHHVTQRGNRRQQTFFTDEDYQVYLELMSDGLNLAINEAHRRYTRRINFREDIP
jgi:putative transposase